MMISANHPVKHPTAWLATQPTDGPLVPSVQA